MRTRGLKLNRETLRVVNDHGLRAAQGGGVPVTGNLCYQLSINCVQTARTCPVSACYCINTTVAG